MTRHITVENESNDTILLLVTSVLLRLLDVVVGYSQIFVAIGNGKNMFKKKIMRHT